MKKYLTWWLIWILSTVSVFFIAKSLDIWTVSSWWTLLATKMNEIIDKINGVTYNSWTNLLQVSWWIQYNKMSVNTCDSSTKWTLIFSWNSFYWCNGSAWKNLTWSSSSSSVDSNTLLLMHFDGNVTDSSWKHTWTPIDLTYVSWPSWFWQAWSFNWSSSVVSFPDSSDWDLIWDFTIECWLYSIDDWTYRAPISYFPTTATSYNEWWAFFFWNRLHFYSSVWWVYTSFAQPLWAWNHYAVVRSWSTLKFYKNWSVMWTHTLSWQVNWSWNLWVWRNIPSEAVKYRNWYIDELRVSNIARRTWDTFTVPNLPY